MSLCYWNRSFPQKWQNCQNLHFLTLGQGNYTPSNYTHKCFNCAEPFFCIWLNSLCRILFDMLSPKMIFLKFLVCFLPVAIDVAYNTSPGTAFLFAKTVCFTGWLLTITSGWRVDFGITDWFLQILASSGRVKNHFPLQIHQGSKEAGIYSPIQQFLILSSFLILVWHNILAISNCVLFESESQLLQGLAVAHDIFSFLGTSFGAGAHCLFAAVVVVSCCEFLSRGEYFCWKKRICSWYNSTDSFAFF